MMRRMQDPPPEDPYPLPLDIEERYHLQPPRFVPFCQALQSRATQLFVAPAKSRRRRFPGQERSGFGFARQPHKLSKETPLGEKLVLHDVQHAAGTLRRFEVHIVGVELPPHADDFAGLAAYVSSRCWKIGLEARVTSASGMAVYSYCIGMWLCPLVTFRGYFSWVTSCWLIFAIVFRR